MKQMRAATGMVLLALLCTAPLEAGSLALGTPEQVGMSGRRLSRLDAVIEAAIAAREAPGAVLLVTRRSRIVYQKAFGARALLPRREPMTLDTIFDLASLTKVVATAPSIMILVEEGKLSLRDRVSRYLPRFAGHGKRAITLLQLLTHYSGLRPDLDLDQPWSGDREALERAYREQPVAPPGQRFLYSDINYLVLGEVVRRVSGMPLEEFSRRRIFEPLGMKDTGFLPGPERRARIAPTEMRQGHLLRGTVHDPTSARMGGRAGHAGLFSTARDLAVYAQMLLDGGRYGEVRILSPLGVRAMTTPQTPPGAAQWRGAGFDIRTRFSTVRGDLLPVGSFGHTGFTGCSLWVSPRLELAIVLMTSRLHPEGKGNVVSLRRKVSSVVAASILEGADLPGPG